MSDFSDNNIDNRIKNEKCVIYLQCNTIFYFIGLNPRRLFSWQLKARGGKVILHLMILVSSQDLAPKVQ